VLPVRTRTANLLRLLLALAVVAVVAERLRALLHAGPTDFDDAYMYLRYAHNALAGHWLAWNPGEAPVYGVTSLLHFLLVTLVSGLLPDHHAAVLQIASGGAALVLLAALVALCARLSRDGRLHGNHLLWSALLLPLLFYREVFFFHAHTGMDTMLAALANTAVVFASLRLAEKPSTTRALAAAIVGLLAVEARPDNVIVAALCPSLALLLLATAPRLRPLLLWAGALGGLLLTDLVLKWRLLGTPLPLAFYAKQPWYYRGFVGEFTWNPFLFLKVALASMSPFLVAVVLFARRASARLLLVLLIPATVTFAALFSVNQIMGHLGRFFFPLLPLLVVAGALAADQWLQELPLAPKGAPFVVRSLLFRLACALLALWGGAGALEAAGRAYESRAQTQSLAPLDGYRISAAAPLPDLDSCQASHEIAKLAAESPPGTTFAMSEHGLVGAFAPGVVIIDVLGLHDPIFARRGFSVAELWRRQPDVIWMPHPDHTQMLRDILDSEELWQHYLFYPDAYTYGVALRQDGSHYAVLADLFAKHWQATYPGLRQDDYVARQSRK
jgi:arabinofuranosyltransferase